MANCLTSPNAGDVMLVNGDFVSITATMPRKAGMHEKIIGMTLNGSGVRDIGRVLKIRRGTVCSVLKKR